jgi:hypothetical protein
MQHCKPICCRLQHLTTPLRFRSWRGAPQTAIGPRYLLDKHYHTLWQPVGLACRGDTQLIAYLLADGSTATEAHVNIAANSWAGHENFRLAAVGTDQARLKLCTIPIKA